MSLGEKLTQLPNKRCESLSQRAGSWHCGVMNRAMPGRETHARAESRRAVLTAPLWMPSPKWSSRSIADALGVSQSFVARTWRDTMVESDVASYLDSVLSQKAMKLTGLLIVPSGSCLVLSPATEHVALQPLVPLAERTRRRLRSVLAADLVRNELNCEHPGALIDDFWRAIGSLGYPYTDLVIVFSGDIPVPETASAPLACSNVGAWQGTFRALCRLAERANVENFGDVEGRLRRWYQMEDNAFREEAFSWVAKPEQIALAETSAVHGVQRDGPVSQNALADDIVLAIRQGLAAGTFKNYDEISDRTLSQLLGTSRGRIRQALRILADDGLVTATTESTVVVRLPAVADVVETYAARRALGTMAVRAASRWAPDRRESVAHLLEELRLCAERHDIDGAQQADLAFQNALFQASGLARIPSMLESLSKQTLMFISVIGLRYAYPPSRIVEQDTAIFEAVSDGDKDSAALSWQAKIDEGARYMVEQITQMNRGSTRIEN